MTFLIHLLKMVTQNKDAMSFFSCNYYKKIVSFINKNLYNKRKNLYNKRNN
jgi:hypothetical protein